VKAFLPKLYEYWEEADYAVIGMHILEEPYSGKRANLPGTERLTWFTRFFDYL
jgi:hypothetical protein